MKPIPVQIQEGTSPLSAVPIDEPIAHLRVEADRICPHALEEHLFAVATKASTNAEKFGAGDWAFFAGLWHDLGKYRSGFQRYIRQANDVNAHIEGRVAGREKTHSAAGALWAEQHLVELFGRPGHVVARILSYLIAGHHAGLDNWFGGLNNRLAGEDARKELADTLAACPPGSVLSPELQLPTVSIIPTDTKNGIPGSYALWVRMLFSALVDADFLDTETFMDARRTSGRAGHPDISRLLQLFDRHIAAMLVQVALRGNTDSAVNRLRRVVLRQCRDKGSRAKGVFTLTVPTGGGKTLSSLAFALEHAKARGLRRIVYAIPYTSIIEQTAKVFREIFGDENVVEHHSNVETDPARESARSRLACENWDAPLIVTTNVQLLESLFSRRTSRCRKLHNIVGSVIVLDEAQLLPVEFLQPILDALRILVSDFGVTLVLCTATQPVLTSVVGFDARRNLRGFDSACVTEIIDDVPALYAALRRVDVHRPVDLNVKREWKDIAAEIADHPVALAIVNRRKDARELHGLLKMQIEGDVWHLSALMCPQHRSDAISRIKTALAYRRDASARGEPVRPLCVVSTQLVEAGVDIDFPVVFRALAGLDSIAQAAGRCNREGALPEPGQVYVFVPSTDPPPGLLRQARDTCKSVWQDVEDDPFALPLFQRYFRKLYADGNLDKQGICEMLRAGRDADVRFRDAAEAFRLIDNEDGATVIVRHPVGDSHEVEQWIAMAERDGPQRWLMRKLQRFGVTIYQRDISRLLAIGDIREMTGCPGLYVQVSDLFYDPELGANVEGAPGDPGSLVI